MQAQAEQYRDALQYEVAYAQWKAGEHVGFLDEHLLEMHSYRYKKAVRPAALLLLDDCQSTAVLSSSQKNPFTNLVSGLMHAVDTKGYCCCCRHIDVDVECMFVRS